MKKKIPGAPKDAKVGFLSWVMNEGLICGIDARPARCVGPRQPVAQFRYRAGYGPLCSGDTRPNNIQSNALQLLGCYRIIISIPIDEPQ